MEKENINLTINGEVKTPIELVIREGDAIRHSYPKKYVAEGVITAPGFFSKRITNPEDVVVEYSYLERTIKLFENPTDNDKAEVKGVLKTNPDLMAFGINKDKYFTSSELIKFIRKYAHCFKSTTEAKELINSLQNFEFKFEQANIKSDDRKGNTEESVKNAIIYHKGEIKKQVQLHLPLYIGIGKETIDLEVEIERQGTNPVFGFYSINMETFLEKTAEAIIREQVVSMIQQKFTCIQTS